MSLESRKGVNGKRYRFKVYRLGKTFKGHWRGSVEEAKADEAEFRKRINVAPCSLAGCAADYLADCGAKRSKSRFEGLRYNFTRQGKLFPSWQPRFLNNCPADHFDDLGDDCVSKGSKSVHPAGNPISHSTHVGFNGPLTAVCKFIPPSRPCVPGPVDILLCGVGHIFAQTCKLVIVLRGPPFMRRFIAM